MSNQRKDERCCRIVPSGYEWGFLGMEGRGLFAGATVAGVHAEITGLQKGFDRARGSIGFQEKLFVGIGNNMGRALRRNGFELVDRMGDHNDKSTKFTFRKAGSSEYGNIEFGSRVWNNDAYCSYNYGNNFITHFLIDYLGWKDRGY